MLCDVCLVMLSCVFLLSTAGQSRHTGGGSAGKGALILKVLSLFS